MKNVAPLPSSFMLTGILGILISVFYLYPQSARWGFTLAAFFAIILIASLISMTYAPVDERRKKR